MGGKNVIMVMDDARLDLAVEGALWGGFGTSGQRCTAASRVVVHEKVYREFLDRFLAGVRSLRVGNGLEAKVQMGPCVNESQLRDGRVLRQDRSRGGRAAGRRRQPARHR